MNSVTMTSSGRQAAQSAGHTVLVVEDELIVRMPIAEYLRDCGYNVLEASNAAEAMALLDGAAVSVVFSDVRMPGPMDGFALAKWCEAHHPGIPVLLTTGYSANRIKMADAGAIPLITKPYTQEQVAHRIAAVLPR